jgi:hypothetical protein
MYVCMYVCTLTHIRANSTCARTHTHTHACTDALSCTQTKISQHTTELVLRISSFTQDQRPPSWVTDANDADSPLVYESKQHQRVEEHRGEQEMQEGDKYRKFQSKIDLDVLVQAHDSDLFRACVSVCRQGPLVDFRLNRPNSDLMLLRIMIIRCAETRVTPKPNIVSACWSF